MTTVKSWHCAYETHYHIVFPVKYRKCLLNNEVVKQIQEISREIELRYEIEIEKLGCDINHIHLLCNFHPKYAIGKVVRVFKSITARKLFEEFPELRKELWGGEFWSDGYYVGTVGEKGNWKVVEKYVANQGKTMEYNQLRILE